MTKSAAVLAALFVYVPQAQRGSFMDSVVLGARPASSFVALPFRCPAGPGVASGEIFLRCPSDP